MKRTLLALLLCLCVALLAACQQPESQRFDYFPNAGDQQQNTSNNNQSQNTTQNNNINYDDGSYDPSSEEGRGDEDMTLSLENVPTNVPVTMAPTIRSQYAGATPVPIDPIDKPTATPVPPLTFTYQVYDATKLGLSFEGPIGWHIDDSASDTYVIYNPDPSVDYTATLTLRATSVSGEYNESALRKEILGLLSTIGSTGFSTWSPSNTATRNLIGYNGVYANYTGTLDDGTQVAGRVHATYANGMLYTLHITYPRAYTETYKEGVYDKVRNTIKIVK